MKKIIVAVILVCSSKVSAENFNSLQIMGTLSPATTIYNVKVDILSEGVVVSSGSGISIEPDSFGEFSTHTYIYRPWAFRSGSNYELKLTSSTGETIWTSPITAIPFAQAVRGDQQTGDQNIFGAYGNVGIGTTNPNFRLVVSSDTGAILWVSSFGVHASKFYGDGSGLTGIAGDNLGNHTATLNLNMAGRSIVSASALTATGAVDASEYKISGQKVLSLLSGTDSIGVGVGASGNGDHNTFVGYYAGYQNTTGAANSFIGWLAGTGNTTGGSNTFIGVAAGNSNATGNQNTYVGVGAGNRGGTAGSNAMFGYYAGYYNQTGTENTVLGSEAAGGGNNSFSSATIVGYRAGYYLTTGNNNVIIGNNAGYPLQTGSANIIIGSGQGVPGGNPSQNFSLNIGGVLYGDLEAKTIGVGRIAPEAALDIISTGTVGAMAQIWRNSSGVVVASMSASGTLKADKFVGNGAGLTNLPGDNLGNHVATADLQMAGRGIISVSSVSATGYVTAGSYKVNGNSVLSIPSGLENIRLGVNAGNQNTTGNNNTFLGYSSGAENISGGNNSFVGRGAGYSNTSGQDNSFFGVDSGYNTTNGFSNVFVGNGAGYANAGGSRNTFIGQNTGMSLTTGMSNIVIGFNQDVPSSGVSNFLNIGGLLYGNLSSKTIGISTRVPQAALDVVSTGTANSQFAQMWRDSAGAIVSSISATGVMMATKFVGDGSNLTGIAGGDVYKAASQTFTGQNVFTAPVRFDSTMSVTGNAFSVGGSTLVVSNGNVGIGTTGPGSMLHVAGDATVSTSLTASSVTATGDLKIMGNLGIGSNPIPTHDIYVAGLSRFDGGNSDSPYYGGAIWLDGEFSTIRFGTNHSINFDAYNGGVVKTPLTLLQDGNVGIGNGSPSYRLDVSGDIHASGVFRGDGSGLTGVTASGAVQKTGDTMTGPLTLANGSTMTITGNAFSIGGSTLVVTNGNVGVGTANPGAKLHVSGGGVLLDNSQYLYMRDSIGESRAIMGMDNGGLLNINYHGSFNTSINPNGGKVGIGTTSPDKIIHAADPTQASSLHSVMRLQSGGNSVGAGPAIQFTNTWTGGEGGVWDSWEMGKIGGVYDNTATNGGALVLYTNNSGSVYTDASTEKMRISAGGNVGIGTTSPSEVLHVNRTGGIDAKIKIQAETGQAGLTLLAGSGGTNRATRIDLLNGVASAIVPRWSILNDYEQIGINDFTITDAATRRVTILQGGNVGIGEVSPTARLVVNGNIVSSGTVQATKYYGDGSTLSNIPALAANQTFTGTNSFQGSTVFGGPVTLNVALSSVSVRMIPEGGYAASCAYQAIANSTNTLTLGYTRDVELDFSHSVRYGQIGYTHKIYLLQDGILIRTFVSSGKGNAYADDRGIHHVVKGVSAGTHNWTLMSYCDGGTFIVNVGGAQFSVVALP